MLGSTVPMGTISPKIGIRYQESGISRGMIYRACWVR
jgi:hypothetical protein